MKLQSYLICDDIRTEANGKQILVGVYDSSILLPVDAKFPANLPSLGFFFRFLLEDGDKHFDEVEVKTYLNDKEIRKARSTAIVRDFKLPITISGTEPGFSLPSTGKLEFEVILFSKGERVGSMKPGSIQVGTLTSQHAI